MLIWDNRKLDLQKFEVEVGFFENWILTISDFRFWENFPFRSRWPQSFIFEATENVLTVLKTRDKDGFTGISNFFLSLGEVSLN